MSAAIVVVGLLLTALGTLCALLILIHAFSRSIGTGVMVLLIPAYIFHYAFSQFEHRFKGWVIAGLFGASFAGAVLLQTLFASSVPHVDFNRSGF